MFSFLEKLFGGSQNSQLNKMRSTVAEINAMEDSIKQLSDASLTAKTDEFKRRLNDGETLDDILPEAFAVVRETSRRVLGMRHFDVQLLGGMVLHSGNIAEMKTGEGKTLVATLPVYLNALTGKGVHVITVNDYLAKRDSEWMGKLYHALGLSVGLIVHDLDFAQRKQAYAADITYGTNNEFGFDYLRDNMVIHAEQMVQRPLHYCIVDEVDSILIDEARTPLIISGPGERSTDHYYTMAKVVPKLIKDEDYTIDEKAKTIAPTEQGIAKVEKMLNVENLYDSENLEYNHLLVQALRAHAMMVRDKDYVVKDGEVVIVDEFTGRLMFGRRYSDGLHQAIEAKEGLKVERESQTLAAITFQNYFRMYDKLAGMTGTAKTEEQEFIKIYGLEVFVIPPNKQIQRVDMADVIYKTKTAKYRAVINEIQKRYANGQPLLVGTTSIAQSEELSRMLKKLGIPHNVLNAKFHEQEAEIVAQAGQKGQVTIATNMAGRGTDIVLGEGVPELGGLHMEENEEIQSSLVTKSIEKAQKKVENRNFNIRKYILEYDDVMNQQREVLYDQRRRILMGEDLKDQILSMTDRIILDAMNRFADEKLYPEEWDFPGLLKHLESYYLAPGQITLAQIEDLSRQDILDLLLDTAHRMYEEREKQIGSENMRELEKAILLKVVDAKWMDHLDAMDMLKEGIGLRSYGQKNPLVEYKFEAYEMFQEMMQSIQETVVMYLYHIQITFMQPVETEDHLEHATSHLGDEPAPIEPVEKKLQK